jgi:membrane protein DedA with SNARE-associated domain
MSVVRFLLWDILALCLSAPVLIGLGYYFSDHLERARKGVARVEHYAVLVAVLGLVGILGWAAIRSLRSRNSR